MNSSREFFGTCKNGESVDLFTLSNDNGMKVKITNFGGIITSLEVPDRNGNIGDVVLGFDCLDKYLDVHPYFGTIVGRYANRIKDAQFQLDGNIVYLSKNETPNHLHGGFKGFDKVIWQAELLDLDNKKTLKLKYISEDGEEGYPGNLTCSVSFSLYQHNELEIHYTCTTDKTTVVNLTHHDYFNLKDGGQTTVFDHELTIYADSYTPMDEANIPTGEIASLRGLNIDFSQPLNLGRQLKQTDLENGFNVNYIIQKKEKKLAHAADLFDPISGRFMEVWTTQPGLQLYTAAHLDGKIVGKNGVNYKAYHGLCLEGQHFPCAPNYPHFSSTILTPETVYDEQYNLRFKCLD